jgi:hypothetical protein
VKLATFVTVSLSLFLSAACGGSDEGASPNVPSQDPSPAETPAPSVEEEDHEHAEDSLGTVEIGGLAVDLAQGHGAVLAGKEGHLVVELPYSDSGATVVRAWIGTEDRTLSYVGKGEYAPSHDDYDVHATAPDPLPANALWWIEIEKPDGTKLVGSARPIVE